MKNMDATSTCNSVPTNTQIASTKGSHSRSSFATSSARDSTYNGWQRVLLTAF